MSGKNARHTDEGRNGFSLSRFRAQGDSVGETVLGRACNSFRQFSLISHPVRVPSPPPGEGEVSREVAKVAKRSKAVR